MSHYCNPERLSELLLDAKGHGVGEELVRLVDSIILGVFNTFGPHLDYDEVHQECWLAVMKLVPHYENRLNAFTFLTYTFKYKVWGLSKQARKRRHVSLEDVGLS